MNTRVSNVSDPIGIQWPMHDATFTTDYHPFNIIKIQIKWTDQGLT